MMIFFSIVKFRISANQTLKNLNKELKLLLVMEFVWFEEFNDCVFSRKKKNIKKFPLTSIWYQGVENRYEKKTLLKKWMQLKIACCLLLGGGGEIPA